MHMHSDETPSSLVRVSFRRADQPSSLSCEPEERRRLSSRGATLTLSDAVSFSPISHIQAADIVTVVGASKRLIINLWDGTYRLAFKSTEERELWMALLETQGVPCRDASHEQEETQPEYIRYCHVSLGCS